jgi:Gas vesicle synthesis protein GvpL/GvpF
VAAEERTEVSVATKTETSTGWYVYGILPGDVELTEEIKGVGDREVKLVHGGQLAALVSEVELTGPLGTPEDLQAHQELLDSTATGAPVLPLRFGAVLTSEDAVVSELLEANHEDFMAALEELEGRLEYQVKGRYAEDAILEEILEEDQEAAQLRDEIRDTDPDATRDARIRLGEIINNAVAAKREQDTKQLLDAMEGHCVASVVRDPTHELDAVNVAFLVEEDQEDDLDQVVDDLGKRWEDRIELRVLGPMAAYDFVGVSQPAEQQ